MAKNTKKDLKKFSEDVRSGKVEVTFAPQDKIEEYDAIARVFLEKILKHPEAFITDMSSVHDFDQWIPGVRILTMEEFGVDIQPLLEKSGNLAEIFEYITKKPKPTLTLDEILTESGIRRKAK